MASKHGNLGSLDISQQVDEVSMPSVKTLVFGTFHRLPNDGLLKLEKSERVKSKGKKQEDQPNEIKLVERSVLMG